MDLKKYFYESADVKKYFIESNQELLKNTIALCISCFKAGGKILIAGNGGSAADAQHRAAEFMGRYKLERNPLAALALTTDTSNLTAVSNDYDFDVVFSRQIEGLGNTNDIFISISTSGNSINLIKAIEICKSKGMKTIALLGKGGGKIKDIVDIALVVPSDNTPRIQECHQTIYHTICEEIEINLNNSGM